MRNNKIKSEIDDIKNWEEKIKRNDWIYKANKYKYSFQQYEVIDLIASYFWKQYFFGESIYTGKINIDEYEMYQNNLLKKLIEFNEKSRPRTVEGKDKKNTFQIVIALYEGWVSILNTFRSRIFLIKKT